jgi:GR25 family glycosyltransferase involved in LPS biosynthesis
MSELPPTYCIWNREIPRRRISEAHFKNFGIPVTFVEGFYGKGFGIRSAISTHNNAKGEPWYISQGHLGLCLSHYMVWTLAWHQGHEEILVLEDDAFFGTVFHDGYRRARKDLPKDWQVCYLGWLHRGHDRDMKKARGNVYSISGCPFGTHAMLLKRDAIRTLLDTQRRMDHHIDINIDKYCLPKLKTYFVYPSIVSHRSQNGKKDKPKEFRPTV